MTAREFIALKDLKDECWSQYTDQLALAMEEYAKQKSWEAWQKVVHDWDTYDGEKSNPERSRQQFLNWWENNK